MKNFKELKKDLILNDTILDAVTKKIKELNKDAKTEQILIKQYQDVHKETFKEIIEEMSIRLNQIDLEIQSLKDEKRSIELFTPYHVEKGFKKGS